MNRDSLQVYTVAASAALTACIYFLYLANHSAGAWQFYALAGACAIMVLVAVLSARLSYNRTHIAAWTLIGMGQLAFLAAVVFISGIALTSIVSLITFTLLSASLLLPARQGRIGVYLAIAAAAFVAFVDWIKPGYQLSPPPQLNTFLTGLLTLAGLVYLYLLARKLRTFSLRSQLISIFILISALSMGSAIIVANLTIQRQLTAEANTRLLSAASQTAQQVDNFIQANLAALSAESRLPVMAQYLALPSAERHTSELESQINQTLWALVQKDPLNISSYGLLDNQGINVADVSPEDAGELEFSRDYFILPLKNNEPYVSPVEFSRNAGEAVIFFSAPVISSSGETLGVLRLRYRASTLQHFMVENKNLAGPDSYPFLVDEHSLRLAHGLNPDLIFKSVIQLSEDQWLRLMQENRLPVRARQELSTNLPQFAQALGGAASQPYYRGDLDDQGSLQQAAMVNLESRPWQVVFAQPHERLLAPMRAQTRNITVVGLLIAGGVTIVGIFLARLLAAPIARLTHVARQIAAGDFSARAEEMSGYELGTLAAAFNTMTEQLHTTLAGLEQRVAERTLELEQRAQRLKASAEVGSAITNLRLLDELLPQVTHLISERFGYYHVGIFLLDASGEFAMLRAANSTGGERMLERGHRLKVGETGIVGYVAAKNEARIALDVGRDNVYYDNPDLPETRAEMALPLAVGGTVLGVLDVQSTRPGAFNEEDITILQVLADQIAVAIENARLFAENQAALESTRRAYGQLSREAWLQMLQKRSGSGYLASHQDSIYPALKLWTPEMVEASQSRQTVQAEDGNLVIPIKDRESVLGVLRLRKPAGQPWSNQEIALAETLSDQLFLALESARLFQETQARAVRERLAGEITAKLRASNDPQTILQTAVQELRQVLHAGSIQTPSDPDREGKTNGGN